MALSTTPHGATVPVSVPRNVWARSRTTTAPTGARPGRYSQATWRYVWQGALHAVTVAESLTACGFDIRAQIIWAKERLVLGRGHYHGSTNHAGMPCVVAVIGLVIASKRHSGRSP